MIAATFIRMSANAERLFGRSTYNECSTSMF